jgi:hypothetical protein
MSNLIPTTITDKNGVVTTRHKKSDIAVASSRLSGVSTAPSLGGTAIKTKPSIPDIGDSVELESYDFETSDIYENFIVDEESGEPLSDYNEEYDEVDKRVPYLAGEDGVSGVATAVPDDGSFGIPGYHYQVELTAFDGNRGNFRSVTVPFHTGSGYEAPPTVGDVVTALVNDAQMAEQYGPGDLNDFISNLGYDPEEPEDAERVLNSLQGAADTLKSLIGDVRYGDYLHGRDKADFGYDSGITYAR